MSPVSVSCTRTCFFVNRVKVGSCSPEYLLLYTNRGTWRTVIAEIATNICVPLAAILQGAKYNKM